MKFLKYIGVIYKTSIAQRIQERVSRNIFLQDLKFCVK